MQRTFTTYNKNTFLFNIVNHPVFRIVKASFFAQKASLHFLHKEESIHVLHEKENFHFFQKRWCHMIPENILLHLYLSICCIMILPLICVVGYTR